MSMDIMTQVGQHPENTDPAENFGTEQTGTFQEYVDNGAGQLELYANGAIGGHLNVEIPDSLIQEMLGSLEAHANSGAGVLSLSGVEIDEVKIFDPSPGAPEAEVYKGIYPITETDTQVPPDIDLSKLQKIVDVAQVQQYELIQSRTGGMILPVVHPNPMGFSGVS